MKEHGRVQSVQQPEPKVIDDFSVWIATDVEKISRPATEDEPGVEGYEYTLTQYSKDEYIAVIDEKNTALENEITSTQLALCEVYELLG